MPLEQCEPGLIFWLIEELLYSQTIDGCRKVFDYLESRRERNTKVCGILVPAPLHVKLANSTEETLQTEKPDYP